VFCPSCGTDNDDAARFCRGCGSAISARAASLHPPSDPRIRSGGVESSTSKNPTLAVVLSLVIPGMGQFYNGDPIKGSMMLCVALVGSFLILPWLAMCVWSVIDAYQVASGKAKKWSGSWSGRN
jgi:TM2 domain-containing membrane protein YozV